MRSKVRSLAFLLLLLPSLVAAQEEGRPNQIVSLAEGGFVGFKSEIARTGRINASAAAREVQGELRARAFVDEHHIIHRVLLDGAGKYIFGYDVLIEAVPASKMFNIAVTPLDPKIEKELLAGGPGSQPQHIPTLPQSAEPQILDDGDSIALDLLVNPRSGLKIVDLVRVSFARENLFQEMPRSLPKDFTLEAVALRVVDFRLLVDDSLVGAGKPGTDFNGALIWCYVEGEGRFIFSLVPREGYQFKKVGIIADNRIEFSLNGKRFEWLSTASILPTGGTWNLWVLHDPGYLPFGTQQVAIEEKNKLDKLEDSIKAVETKIARIREPTPTGFSKKVVPQKTEETGTSNQSSPKRFRVMVGAADRMENLLPK